MNWISTYYLRYAALGCSVIPIKTLAYATRSTNLKDIDRDAKAPLVDWKSYQKERADEKRILQWGSQWAFAGIGIVTGAISDIFIIDDDRKGRPPLELPRTEKQETDYQTLLKRYGTLDKLREAYKAGDAFCDALAKLPTAISLTSKGKHYYFRMPRDADNEIMPLGRTIKFLPGIDGLGDGGYALVPPSIHPSGTSYVWENPPEDGIMALPHWVLETIKKLPNVAYYDPTIPAMNNTNGHVSKWRLGMFSSVGEGERNDTLTSMYGKWISETAQHYWREMRLQALAWNNTHSNPPLPYEEVMTICDSIEKRHLEKYGLTREQFYQPYVAGADPEIIVASELGFKDLHAPSYAVKDFFLDGTTQLFGKPKAGKSFLAMQAGLAVASGKPLFPRSVSMYAYANHPGGFETIQGDVLYLALEDSQLRLRDRAKSVFGSTDLPERLFFSTTWPSLVDGGLVAIERWIDSVQFARLVVIDPMAAFVGGGEAKGQGNVFRAEYRMFRPIWEMGQRRKIPIVIVDHASKGKGKFGSSDPFDSGAGTLGSQAAVDTVMIMEHGEKGPTARINFKGRDIERGFLDIEHTSHSPVWKIAAPPIESDAEVPKKAKKVPQTA